VSGSGNPADVGTIDADSGNRLGGTLTGIDIPTLRDAWATAPYLHRGQAATIGDSIRAHEGVAVSDAELANLVAYVSQIGSQEGATGSGTTPNTGTGLAGAYFNNTTLSGSPALERVEKVLFTWQGSPGPGVNANQFSVRWTGFIEASATGNFQFQTRSNDGLRLWIDGNLVIDHWTPHASADDTTGPIALVKNQRYAVVMEHYDNTGIGVAQLKWKMPSTSSFTSLPIKRLYAN
jgi:hypothetical protein